MIIFTTSPYEYCFLHKKLKDKYPHIFYMWNGCKGIKGKKQAAINESQLHAIGIKLSGKWKLHPLLRMFSRAD